MTGRNYDEVVVMVKSADLKCDASLHYNLYTNRPISYQPSDHVHDYYPSVILYGECLYSEKLSGHNFIAQIIGRELGVSNLTATLDDFHKRDEFGSRMYRKYKEDNVPILSPPPKGVGTYRKVRGKPAWEADLWMGKEFVRDIMAMMNIKEQLYIYMETYTENRIHWIRALTVTSKNPIGDLI
ncbi:hypothetical protein [Methylophaga sulfidovorans]|uniref:Uncharacterized protein n=1 Tax=Methylophaga sulfidovorans TaxID=45496 RepID=A0A1I4ACJ7_9GAMM|nr:hypothetical protein [Methylophaga sulfidovorans]SFK53900.1 hypothetical protein SAMN04488079_1145 [Methylophaga sulfidovorans]